MRCLPACVREATKACDGLQRPSENSTTMVATRSGQEGREGSPQQVRRATRRRGMVVSTSKAVSADRVETAALQLAISAREFLGLPVEPHDTVTTTEAPVVLPYVPPMLLTNPGSLEFARRLTAASPFMIQAEALNDRPQLQQWKEPGYLVKKMGDKRVKVSVTPDGQADDLKCLPDGTTVFVLPAETNM